MLPLWSTFVEKVQIQTFWAKLVRKRSEFTQKSPNFIISPSYNAYFTLMNCPNNCRSATNSHTIIIQPSTTLCAITYWCSNYHLNKNCRGCSKKYGYHVRRIFWIAKCLVNKVCIHIKNWPKRSEKSPHLSLKMVRKKSEFSIFESDFNSGSTVCRLF